jgi:hypothetical protein
MSIFSAFPFCPLGPPASKKKMVLDSRKLTPPELEILYNRSRKGPSHSITLTKTSGEIDRSVGVKGQEI